MIHKMVGNSYIQDGKGVPLLQQEFIYSRTRAALNSVIFHRYQAVMRGRQLREQGFVKRLDEAHIYQGAIQLLCNRFTMRDEIAPGKDCHASGRILLQS